MKKISIFATVIVLLVGGAVFFVLSNREVEPEKVATKSFKECADAGFLVMLSYPRQCRDSFGNLFVEDIGNELQKQNLIIVDSPRPNQGVSSPVLIHGKARGNWFFEASFPVRFYDGDGNEFAVAIATATDDWMTEEFVPFEVLVNFVLPPTEEGTIVFEKSNPSGLLEHDDALYVPVKYKESTDESRRIPETEDPEPEPEPNQNGDSSSRVGIPLACAPAGCSSQLCVDAGTASEIITTCEWLEEYACYQSSFARCEVQTDGKCGWTETEELKICLAQSSTVAF